MHTLKGLVASAVLAAAAASAQPPGPPPGGPADIERLAVLLDLDAYQKTEVERILTEQRQAREATRSELAASGERPSREEMSARREQLREDMVAKLGTVLTEQQLTKFKLLMERPERRAGAPRPPSEE